MMYGFGSGNTEKISVNFPATSVAYGCKLQKAEYGATDSSQFIDFHFIKEDEETIATMKARIFPVNKSYVNPRDGQTQQQALEAEVKRWNTRLQNICTKFNMTVTELVEHVNNNYNSLPDDQKSFKAFAELVCKLINERNTPDTFVNIKMLPNDKGYPILPRYGKIIENSVRKEEVKEGESPWKETEDLVYSDWEKNSIKQHTGDTTPVSTIEEVDTDKFV